MNDERYDLAIVGSGGAAFAARERDLAVVMVESATVGGTCVNAGCVNAGCVNAGCVPSKALLAAAEAREVAADRRFPGVLTEAGPVDLAALMEAKQELAEAMRAEKYAGLAAEYGWRIVHGTGRFAGEADAPVLHVSGIDGVDGAAGTVRISAAQYLIASGATPCAPPIDGLTAAGYLTSTTAMELTTLPASMVVVGGNAVGLEAAQMFARLGVHITVVEAQDRLAPFDEPELSDALADTLTEDGITVITGAAVTPVRRTAAGYTLTIDTAHRRGVETAAEQLLVATGRRPATASLRLADIGVKTNARGAVVADEYQRTTNSRVWAAGDVTGGPQFVYVAAAQGAGRLREHAAGHVHLARVRRRRVDGGGRGRARAGHRNPRALPLSRVPRPIVDRDTRGLVKMVADRATGRLIGVSRLAHGAGDAFLAAVYALRAGMTVQGVADTWAPYLTAAEALKLAAQTFTSDVTKLSCCAP